MVFAVFHRSDACRSRFGKHGWRRGRSQQAASRILKLWINLQRMIYGSLIRETRTRDPRTAYSARKRGNFRRTPRRSTFPFSGGGET